MFWGSSEDISIFILVLVMVLLGQTVVSDEGVPVSLGVGVVGPVVVSVVVGEVSVVVPTRATVEPTTGVVPAQNNVKKLLFIRLHVFMISSDLGDTRMSM